MGNPADPKQPPSWLASIPGYRGYHDKEQRRLADRALREDLAGRLTTIVQVLQRLSATLASARRYDQLGSVDSLTGRLQHLIDRLRTAPEGYRGLFERERIDEAVLDQVLAFDASLATGIEQAGRLAGGLRADGPIAPLAGPDGQELIALIDRLHARLDARARVFSGGQPLAPDEALAVLADPTPAPAPLTLRPGDAVSYGGTDYVVDAVIDYQGQRTWTEYRLRDGDAERWLMVEPAATSLLAPVPAGEVTLEGDGTASYATRRYRAGAHGQATASVTGPSGSRRGVSVTYRTYVAEPDGVLVFRGWGDEQRHYAGTTIDHDLLSVYPRA